MKKSIIFIFVLLIYHISINAQDINHIKTLDTIYVKFKKSKNQIKEIKENGNYRFYTIYLENNKNREYFNFTKPDYKDYSTDEKRSFLPRNEQKSFLKKHKKDIIGISFFNKYGIVKSTYTAFEKCNVIYIIDCDEQKKGKIILYRVLKYSSYTMGE
ncbi:hypothetical protein [Flavobacterium geliluteum]|uniref:Uncharacterized protein n=1 Tax=Flavobacterium geliluteum TaxID=2816120 RepID=A0A941AXR5_9FLAO|nr:hypothetical protein [Flavobacterium geliluteum]MBP4139480.1 hypothetical protein [Flavobacterium geliluteum]